MLIIPVCFQPSPVRYKRTHTCGSYSGIEPLSPLLLMILCILYSYHVVGDITKVPLSSLWDLCSSLKNTRYICPPSFYEGETPTVPLVLSTLKMRLVLSHLLSPFLCNKRVCQEVK